MATLEFESIVTSSFTLRAFAQDTMILTETLAHTFLSQKLKIIRHSNLGVDYLVHTQSVSPDYGERTIVLTLGTFACES